MLSLCTGLVIQLLCGILYRWIGNAQLDIVGGSLTTRVCSSDERYTAGSRRCMCSDMHATRLTEPRAEQAAVTLVFPDRKREEGRRNGGEGEREPTGPFFVGNDSQSVFPQPGLMCVSRQGDEISLSSCGFPPRVSPEDQLSVASSRSGQG